MIKVLAFDADDTLWHNETLFTMTQERFCTLLTRYCTLEWINNKLQETKVRNLVHFGYGVKGFTLSMIETAIELSKGRITGAEIQEIIDYGRAMLASPISLLEGVAETIADLAIGYDLMLLTKGDLLDQESKLARSGLGDNFNRIEVVSEKNIQTYERLLKRHDITPREFLMVGNSLKSDILPVVAVGGHAVHIPYHPVWEHEMVEATVEERAKYTQLDCIKRLPAFLQEMASNK